MWVLLLLSCVDGAPKEGTEEISTSECVEIPEAVPNMLCVWRDPAWDPWELSNPSTQGVVVAVGDDVELLGAGFIDGPSNCSLASVDGAVALDADDGYYVFGWQFGAWPAAGDWSVAVGETLQLERYRSDYTGTSSLLVSVAERPVFIASLSGYSPSPDWIEVTPEGSTECEVNEKVYQPLRFEWLGGAVVLAAGEAAWVEIQNSHYRLVSGGHYSLNDCSDGCEGATWVAYEAE